MPDIARSLRVECLEVNNTNCYGMPARWLRNEWVRNKKSVMKVKVTRRKLGSYEFRNVRIDCYNITDYETVQDDLRNVRNKWI